MHAQSDTETRMAVIYARVSDPRQKTKGDGLRSQQARCREYADYNSYEIAQIFEDDMTGDSLKRPGFDEMLAFLRKNRRDKPIVIIDDITRFARDVVSHWTLRDIIKEAGGQLESPSMKFGESSDDILHENMMAVMAQHQRQKNAEQTQNRMRGRLLNGYWVFQAPVGYRYERVSGHSKLLVKNEPLTAIVTEALEGFASGRFGSQAEVKRFLESQPAFPKVGDQQTVRPMTVTRMLKQSLYAGMVEHTAWGISMREGHHEALISFETFQKIQDHLNEKKKAPKRKDLNKDFPLRGAVSCANCDKPLTGAWSKGKYKRYAYYICQNKSCYSYGKSIRKEAIEDDFAEILANLVPSNDLYALMEAIFKNAWEQVHERRAEQNKAHTEEKKAIQGKIENLLSRILDTETPSVIKAYEEKIAALEKQKLLLAEQMKKAPKNHSTYRDKLELAMQFLQNPLRFWNSGELNRQRMALKLTFAAHLAYDRNTGYRTPELSMPFKVLDDFSNPEKTMVPLTGETSNSLFNTLADWNDQLKHLEDTDDDDDLVLPS